jgi:hypothetical protein
MHDLMRAAIEQHLCDLTDAEFAALVARVRPPAPRDERETDPTIERTGTP